MKRVLPLFFAIFLLSIGNEVQAQPGPGPDPDVPITGIEYLLGAGVLYGLRRMLKKDKNDK